MVDFLLNIFLFSYLEALLEFLYGEFFQFCLFHKLHVLRWIIITTNNKLCSHRKFLGCQTKCLLGDIVAHTLNFDKDTAWSYRRNESFRVTFTFTHADFGRLLGDWFIGEYSNPDLTLTLHVTSYGYTGCFNLAAGNPFCVKGLDTERTESQLVAALGFALHTAFLLSSKFSFLWL